MYICALTYTSDRFLRKIIKWLTKVVDIHKTPAYPQHSAPSQSRREVFFSSCHHSQLGRMRRCYAPLARWSCHNEQISTLACILAWMAGNHNHTRPSAMTFLGILGCSFNMGHIVSYACNRTTGWTLNYQMEASGSLVLSQQTHSLI
jgi:hypothetical protein